MTRMTDKDAEKMCNPALMPGNAFLHSLAVEMLRARASETRLAEIVNDLCFYGEGPYHCRYCGSLRKEQWREGEPHKPDCRYGDALKEAEG